MFNLFKRNKNAGNAIPSSSNSATITSQNKPSDETVVKNTQSDNENITSKDVFFGRKDVVNLLLPPPEYQTQQKTGVSGLLQNLMSGGRKNRRNKTRGRLKSNQISRAESCKEMPTDTPPEMKHQPLFRSNSEADRTTSKIHESLSAPVSDVDLSVGCMHVTDDAFASAKNKLDEERIYESVPDLSDSNPADFVKDIVLQKYATRQNKKPHVSLVYLTGAEVEKEKRHAEDLLNEIAKKIDCTLDDNNSMGASDSKNDKKTVESRNKPYVRSSSDQTFESLKKGFQSELNKILDQKSTVEIVEVECADSEENSVENDECAKPEKVIPEYIVTDEKNNIEYEIPKMIIETAEIKINQTDETKLNESDLKVVENASPYGTPEMRKKSNLKIPRSSDTEGGSDDDKSDNGSRKRVTFNAKKYFDDGDEETASSLDSVSDFETSEEEDSDIPDNDELLGGVTVARNDDKVIITELEDFDDFKKLNNDNSDSGFIEHEDSGKVDECESSESVLTSGEENGEEEIEVTDEEEELEEEVEEDEIYLDVDDERKSLVNQEDKFQNQVAQLTELANARNSDAERVRDQVLKYRKDIESRDKDIERLKSELESAHQESELVRQRSKFLEEEVSAARICSAELAEQRCRHDGTAEAKLRQDLESALTRCSQLEFRIQQLEEELERLLQEKDIQDQKTAEVLAVAEAKTAKWRKAHESARSQAAATAERLLADCEWKMRELERRARDAERINGELTDAIESYKKVSAQKSHLAELQQLRGVVTEQQHSVVSLSQQLQRLEASEESLKIEVHELKELLEIERNKNKMMEVKHKEEIQRLQKESASTLEQTRTDMQRAHAAARTSLERAHAERTRTAIAQLRAENEKAEKNSERKLREANTKLESLKEELESKQSELQSAMEDVRSKTDWELMQLRHMLDKTDIQYANQIENLTVKHEIEIDSLIEAWSAKLRTCEEEAAQAADDARITLNNTRYRMEQERLEQINRLKDHHKREMEEQWEKFMFDKEECLARMKLECKQEGDEEREKAERELIREIEELKAQLSAKDSHFGELAGRAAAVGRTLAVTEQELREALERERTLRMDKSDNATKLRQVEKGAKEQIEHLTRKCATLKKLFDDIRARLSSREQIAEEESKTQQREIQRLKTEVARLTKLLIQSGSPPGTRTRADGCDTPQKVDSGGGKEGRRKGSGYELKKRTNSDTKFPLIPEASRQGLDEVDQRPRAKSVDLPAVQVPTRIKQFKELEDRQNS